MQRYSDGFMSKDHAGGYGYSNRLGSYRVSNYDNSRISSALSGICPNWKDYIPMSINLREQTLHLSPVEQRVEDYYLIRKNMVDDKHKRSIDKSIQNGSFNPMLLDQRVTDNLRLLPYSNQPPINIDQLKNYNSTSRYGNNYSSNSYNNRGQSSNPFTSNSNNQSNPFSGGMNTRSSNNNSSNPFSGSNRSTYGNNSSSSNRYGNYGNSSNNAFGNNTYGNNSYSSNSYGNNSYGNNSYGNNSYGNNSYGNNSNSYGNNSYGNNSYSNNSTYGGGSSYGNRGGNPFAGNSNSNNSNNPFAGSGGSSYSNNSGNPFANNSSSQGNNSGNPFSRNTTTYGNNSNNNNPFSNKSNTGNSGGYTNSTGNSGNPFSNNRGNNPFNNSSNPFNNSGNNLFNGGGGNNLFNGSNGGGNNNYGGSTLPPQYLMMQMCSMMQSLVSQKPQEPASEPIQESKSRWIRDQYSSDSYHWGRSFFQAPQAAQKIIKVEVKPSTRNNIQLFNKMDNKKSQFPQTNSYFQDEKQSTQVTILYNVVVRWKQSSHEEIQISGKLNFSEMPSHSQLERKVLFCILEKEEWVRNDAEISLQSTHHHNRSTYDVRGTIFHRKINVPKGYDYMPHEFNGFNVRGLVISNQYGRIQWPAQIHIKGIDFTQAIEINRTYAAIDSEQLQQYMMLITINSLPSQVERKMDRQEEAKQQLEKSIRKFGKNAELVSFDPKLKSFTFRIEPQH